MPHKDGAQFKCDINDNGDLTYPPDSPAETLGSEAMGVPAKSGSPWTDQAPSGSSAMKPSQDRHQPRRQIPKTSFLDAGSNNNSIDDDQDDRNNHIQFPRTSAPVVSAPFLNIMHPDNSATGPTAPRSGQNAFLSMTDDEEDETASADDKSPTPRPSRLTLSRKRTMSDASDLPVPPQLKQVTSSRQREMSGMSEMSETQLLEERPKKKGILHFSSAAPSMADTVDEEPPRNIPNPIQNESGLPSHPTSHTRKKMINRRKSDLKSNVKVKLSALDLEGQDEMVKEKGDPFDQANIPPSRGLSPGPSMRKPKPAPKKQAAGKSSPTGKKPAAASSKVSARKKQAARPRQKAKPSAAKPVEGSTGIPHGEDSRNNQDPTDKPARLNSNRAQAKAKQTTASRSTLKKNAEASGNCHSDPQIHAISISSAYESESVATDGSDDDEYVDDSGANAVNGNSEPPKTRNKTAIYKSHNEPASTTESKGDVQIEGQDDTNHDQVQDEDGVASKCLSDQFTVGAAAPGTDQNTEVTGGGQQPKKKAADIQSKTCSPPEANSAYKQQSPAQDQISPDEIETESLAAEEVIQPLKKVRTMHPTKAMSKNTRPVQNGFELAVKDQSESGRPRTRLTRRSQANQSGNDSTPSDPEKAQSREEVKETQGLVVPSHLPSHDKLSKRSVDTKPKNRKANIISFSADGPRNNGKPRQRGSATNHQSREPDSVVSDSKPLKATKAGQKNAESNTRAFKSGPRRHEPFELSGTPLARSLQPEQPSSLVEDQPPAVRPAVEISLPSEVHNLNSSHVWQMRIEMVAEETEPIAAEDDKHKSSPPTLAINSEKPVPSQIENKGTLPIGDQDHADRTVDLKTNDRLDEPNMPQSLEQPDAIDENTAATQLKDSATIRNLIDLELKGGVDDLKHPLAYECTSQTVVPDNEQPEICLPVDEEEHVLKHQTERHIRQSLHPAHSLPEQQSEKLQKQPVWGRQSMSQQQMSTNKHPKEEGKYINHMSRDLEVPQHRQATHPKQQMLKKVTQSGEEPAKSYLQDLSVNFQRPSKKQKVDLPGPTAASPVANVKPQFCIPTNSFSSDDVFAPDEGKERRDIDNGIMNRLRGIESEKDSSEPELKTHGPIDSHIEKWHGPPHQRPSKRLVPNATHARSVQSTTHDKFRDQNSVNTSGPALWRCGLMNRYQGLVPLVQPKEQLAVEDPKLDQTIEDSMHQIVTGVLRALHSKESQVHGVVEDYRSGGGRIVQSIASAHFEEREQLLQDHEDRRLDYIQTCEEARRHIALIGTGLQGVDLTITAAGQTMDKTLEQLKNLRRSCR